MPDFLSNIAADNLRLCRSKTLLNLADGTYNLIVIPRYAFVIESWVIITTAYAGGSGATGTLGFVGNGESADPDGFMDATQMAVRVAGTKRMTPDTQPGSQGKWFNTAGGLLTITLAASTDTTLMIGHVFMMFSVIH
jgi:hypothetical protein